MFGIGETELVIIVVFAFLLFGPDKLPGMGRTLGRVLRQFREASDGFTEVVQTNIMDPASEELEKSPKQRRREAEATFEEDADAETAPVQDQGAPRRETFAERRARLQAEREAAERAEADAADGDEAASVAGPSAPVADDAAASPDDATPERTSAADLYAISRKSARTLADEAAEADSATTDNEEEDGPAQA